MAQATAHEMIRTMREKGMPVAALAEILRCSRKDVYACLAGGDLGPEAMTRAEAVHRMITDAFGPEFRSVWRIMRQPLRTVEGCLRDLLSAETLDEASITTAFEEQRRSIERYAAMDRNPVTIRMEGRGNPVLDDLPIADLGLGV